MHFKLVAFIIKHLICISNTLKEENQDNYNKVCRRSSDMTGLTYQSEYTYFVNVQNVIIWTEKVLKITQKKLKNIKCTKIQKMF